MGKVLLAMANPNDQEAMKYVIGKICCDTIPLAATEEEIQAAINYYLD